jgi:hypothetical protein
VREPVSSAARRIALALGAYLVLALLVWWLVVPVRQIFLLPPMFVTWTRGALLLAVPVVVAVAWRYPHLGEDPEAGPEDG